MINQDCHLGKVKDAPLAYVPQRATPFSAGLDLASIEDVTLRPQEVRAIRTGLFMKPPEGHCFLVLSRSGMALKHKVIVLNAPGLIDPDYCGPEDEIKVILYNASKENFYITDGQRVAQLLLVSFKIPEWTLAHFSAIVHDPPTNSWTEEADSWSQENSPNRGGLGSTGKGEKGDQETL